MSEKADKLGSERRDAELTLMGTVDYVVREHLRKAPAVTITFALDQLVEVNLKCTLACAAYSEALDEDIAVTCLVLKGMEK